MDDETRVYLDDMRRELSGRFDRLDTKVASLDAKVGGLDVKVDGTRREFGTLIEALRHDVQTVIEGVDMNTKKLAGHTQSLERLRDQMNLRFAVVRTDLAEIQGRAFRRRRPRR